MNRLRYQLPTAIGALLLVAITAFGYLAYRQARRGAIVSAAARLTALSRQLATVSGQGIALRVNEMRLAASQHFVHEALTGKGPANAAHPALARLLRANPQAYAVELWDKNGAKTFELVDSSTKLSRSREPLPPGIRTGDVTVTQLESELGVFTFAIAVAIREDEDLVGYIVQRRRAAPVAAATMDMVTPLLGNDARLYRGSPATGWVNLLDPTGKPEAFAVATDSTGIYHTKADASATGAVAAVPGTPWFIRVEFPDEAILAPSRHLLVNSIRIGLIVAFFGALAAWGISRRISRPIEELASATAAIADGDFKRRVHIAPNNELGDLAIAFNMMAEHVATSHEKLAQRVAERTGALEAALNRLSASEEQFRSVAATAPIAVLIIDSTGHVKYGNESARILFKYDDSEMIGVSVGALVPDRIQDAYRGELKRFLTVGRPLTLGRDGEISGRRKDGTEFPAEVALGSWIDGNAPVFAAIVHDLTQQKSAEHLLRNYAQRLEYSNRELEAFSYTISHDLRAPLRSIDGFSEALLVEYRDKLDDRGVDYLKRVRGGAQRMSHLIDDLLQLARVSRVELQPRPIQLDALANQTIDELRLQQPGRNVTVRISDGLVANGDGRLMALLMQNLVGNAWKFTAPRTEGIIEVGMQSNGTEPVYFVRDNGVGFDMQYAPKLFDTFQRLHSIEEFPGTGVGLAIVRRIVERHGGRVWATSEVDAGATFFFTLGKVRGRAGPVTT